MFGINFDALKFMIQQATWVRIITVVLTFMGSIGMIDPALNSWIDFRQGNIRGALEQADEEGKLVFVDVVASWCTNCKLMDESTFQSQDVVRLINQYYVPVKIDVESIEGKLFAAQENVMTLPALLVLDETGSRLVKVDQALTAAQMVKILNEHIHKK